MAAAMGVEDANADYVLRVKYDAAQFKQLVATLEDAGFGTTVRRGAVALEVLLFVKLRAAQFAEQAEIDLIRSYEFGVTAKNNTNANRRRIIYDYLTLLKLAGGLAIEVNDTVLAICPVTHAMRSSTFVQDVTVRPTLEQIRYAYGAEISLYFEFAQFYIMWLGYLLIFGVISYVLHRKILLMLYTFINLGWGLLFITFWRRREQRLVHEWGVQNCHLVAEHQAQLLQLNKLFEKTLSYKHTDTGSANRFLKQLAFTPVALGFVAVLVGYQLACFVIEIFLGEVYDGPLKLVLTLLPTVMIVVFVPILLFVYNMVLTHFVKWENHDNDALREKLVLVKNFVLNFLTLYVPLIITLFIYLPFAHLIEPELDVLRGYIDQLVLHNAFYYKYMTKLKLLRDFTINQHRLTNQFFYFVVTNQVIQLVTKYAVPLAITKAKEMMAARGEPDQPTTDAVDLLEETYLELVRHIVALPTYDVNDDYRALVAQYGYLILFGPVWPLAPLVLVGFNLVTLYLDISKVAGGKYFQPPVPRRVDLVQPWGYALFGLTWIALVVLPVITAFYRHGTTPPKTLGQWALDKALVNLLSLIKLVVLMLVLEHGFLVLHYVLLKFLDLYKLSAEWDNDFFENDLKLRHDYYLANVKPTFDFSEKDYSPIWLELTPEQLALAAAQYAREDKTAANKQHEAERLRAAEKANPVADHAALELNPVRANKALDLKNPMLQGYLTATEVNTDLTLHKRQLDKAGVLDPANPALQGYLTGSEVVTDLVLKNRQARDKAELRPHMSEEDSFRVDREGVVSTIDDKALHVDEDPEFDGTKAGVEALGAAEPLESQTKDPVVPLGSPAVAVSPLVQVIPAGGVDNEEAVRAATHPSLVLLGPSAPTATPRSTLAHGSLITPAAFSAEDADGNVAKTRAVEEKHAQGSTVLAETVIDTPEGAKNVTQVATETVKPGKTLDPTAQGKQTTVVDDEGKETITQTIDAGDRTIKQVTQTVPAGMAAPSNLAQADPSQYQEVLHTQAAQAKKIAAAVDANAGAGITETVTKAADGTVAVGDAAALGVGSVSNKAGALGVDKVPARGSSPAQSDLSSGKLGKKLTLKKMFNKK